MAITIRDVRVVVVDYVRYSYIIVTCMGRVNDKEIWRLSNYFRSGSDGNSSIRDVSRSTRFQWPLEQPALVNRRISALTFSTRPQKISNILETNQSSPIVFKRQYLVKLSSVRSITQETLVDFET
uniref:Uncharacterized protein n=1 Tax=Vespula pensylvanica TaxID=30213 RepID=A0A834JM41_VESPE|nr:hypothetical protein H0235_017829 [Vespula pensylvanica]